ncbi:MAG: hypothetical protein GEU96_00555 [Propionibacteriales bacterium]|nr:hypothetical protein [Propionibacteriales bacterium]
MSTLMRDGSTTRSGSKVGAATVAAGPILLLGALLWHPPLPGRLPDNDAVAEGTAADVTRWGMSHLAAAVAAAAIAVAFIVIRSHLRERGDGWLSAVGLALVVVGSTLYAVLPGMEFSALAAHENGTDIAAAQDALQPWFIAVLLSGSLLFAAGTTLFAVAVVRSAPMGRTEAVVIATALVVLGVSRVIPIGVVQFYVQPAAALLALLPLAAVISSRSGERATASAGR